MSDGGKGKENFPDLKGQTRDTVASKLGIGSGKQYEKEKFIADNRSTLTPKDFVDWDEGKLSTNKAYQKIKAELKRQNDIIIRKDAAIAEKDAVIVQKDVIIADCKQKVDSLEQELKKDLYFQFFGNHLRSIDFSGFVRYYLLFMCVYRAY